jgi:hypothetical protein
MITLDFPTVNAQYLHRASDLYKSALFFYNYGLHYAIESSIIKKIQFMEGLFGMKVNRVFVRLFFSYSVVLLFPLVLFIFIYTLTTRIVIEQTITSYESAVRRGSDLISRNIQDLKLVAESVMYDELCKSFLEARSFSDEKLYDLYIQKDALVKYKFYSNVAQIFLYSDATGYLLVPGGGAYLNEMIYEASFSVVGVDYAQWRDFIQRKPINGFYTFSREGIKENPNLVYFMRLAPEASRFNYLAIHVDTSMIHENLMQITELTGGGGAFISTGRRKPAYLPV